MHDFEKWSWQFGGSYSCYIFPHNVTASCHSVSLSACHLKIKKNLSNFKFGMLVSNKRITLLGHFDVKR